MEPLVEIFPNSLELTPSKEKSFIESKLNIKNLTNNYVIFKIYNSKQNLYSVKPSKSFIPPKETKNISVKRFTKEESPSKKDQMLLIFYSIDKIIKDNDDAKEAFNSKLYNEESKQESLITITIKEREDDIIKESGADYNGNNLNEEDNKIKKETKIYNEQIEKLKKEYNKCNQKVMELEKILEVIKTQKQLKSEKEKAIALNKDKDNNDNFKINKKIILITIILLGLIFGANLATKYNNFFYPKSNIIKEAILNQNQNQNENLIERNNSEINITKNESNYGGKILSSKFFLILLLCLKLII